MRCNEMGRVTIEAGGEPGRQCDECGSIIAAGEGDLCERCSARAAAYDAHMARIRAEMSEAQESNQDAILRYLRLQRSPKTYDEICAVTEIRANCARRIARKLQARGWVRITRAGCRSRRHVVEITPAGRKAKG
jgi:predicted transcriptional regulator